MDEFLKKEVQIRRTVALGRTLGVNSLGKVEGKVTVYRPASRFFDAGQSPPWVYEELKCSPVTDVHAEVSQRVP